MDEEDGRPGAVARKSGHLDAPHGVPPQFLSFPKQSAGAPGPSQLGTGDFAPIRPQTPTHNLDIQGETHENVPGK